MRLAIDDIEEPADRYLLILLTTLNRLMLGLWPFWGQGEGAIRVTSIVGPPPRLAQALIPTLRGRPQQWMHTGGYRSRKAEKIAIHTEAPLVLDGEFITPVPGTPIIVDAERQIDFLRC